jgi:hypothetical protein
MHLPDVDRETLTEDKQRQHREMAAVMTKTKTKSVWNFTTKQIKIGWRKF